MAESSDRALSPDEAAYVSAARDKAFVLYEGVRTPHRSCGIALAETFGLATPAYQALRRGGITGKGACGAIRAGEQVLGESAWQARLMQNEPDIVCDNLVRPHGTNLAAEVAALTAEALCRFAWNEEP
jgi:hypothetical protein